MQGMVEDLKSGFIKKILNLIKVMAMDQLCAYHLLGGCMMM